MVCRCIPGEIKCIFHSWQNSYSKCSTVAEILLKLTGNGKGWWAADDADCDCDCDRDRSMRKRRSVLTAIGRRGDSKGGRVPQWIHKSRYYWLLRFHNLTVYRLAHSRARLTGEVLKAQAAPRKKSDSSHSQAWHPAAFSIHNLKSFIAAFIPSTTLIASHPISSRRHPSLPAQNRPNSVLFHSLFHNSPGILLDRFALSAF
jgi:hypothetical protein